MYTHLQSLRCGYDPHPVRDTPSSMGDCRGCCVDGGRRSGIVDRVHVRARSPPTEPLATPTILKTAQHSQINLQHTGHSACCTRTRSVLSPEAALSNQAIDSYDFQNCWYDRSKFTLLPIDIEPMRPIIACVVSCAWLTIAALSVFVCEGASERRSCGASLPRGRRPRCTRGRS